MDASQSQNGSQQNQAQSIESLSRQTGKLEFLLLVSLLVIIILSIGVNILLANQVKVLQARYFELEPAVKNYAQGYHEIDEPMYQKFALALQQYASTNKDFAPIWEKYRPVLTNLLVARTPAPATAQPTKK
jgi:hypothetical protein